MHQTNVLQYLKATVSRVAEKTAFSDGEISLTFSQVYQSSRAIGSHLACAKFYGEPVVVFMNRHPQCICAFFGCIYAGCYYVPIDAQMPQHRIGQILRTLNARVMICDEHTAEMAKTMDFRGTILLYDHINHEIIDEAALNAVESEQLDTDPIYIVFTSGSTGTPKGVAVCHRSVIDYIENLSDTMGFGEQTVFGNQSPLYFDACLKEIYPTIKFGATTYLIPKKLFCFPVALVEFLNQHKINTICWVSSALNMVSSLNTFDTVVPRYLHTIAFGSEIFPTKQLSIWQKALPNAKFTNLYGPTECTGMSCYYHVTRTFLPEETIPIGRPFPNTRILLLDENDTPVQDGSVGQICICGTCLALGYYGDCEKTDAAFVQNPLNPNFPERIYRTGDLGKRNVRGELIFVSRVDHQIKHMGHRIELGEIEVCANALEGIQSCCCVYHKPSAMIAAYYVGDLAPSALTFALQKKLPRYMIPNKILRLDTMPLTANGKMDRVALTNMFEMEQ